MPTAIAPSPAVSPRVQMTARQRARVEQMARRQTSPQRLVRRGPDCLSAGDGSQPVPRDAPDAPQSRDGIPMAPVMARACPQAGAE